MLSTAQADPTPWLPLPEAADWLEGDAPAGTERANNYYRARYYDPKIGRFLSEDPIPLQKRSVREVNAYPYVANDPVNLTDPFGREAGAAMKWDFDRAMDEYNAAGGPPCTNPCRDDTCFSKCMNWMNPDWPFWAAGAPWHRLAGVSKVTFTWGGSTAVGCFWLCLIDPCGIPQPPSTFPWW